MTQGGLRRAQRTQRAQQAGGVRFELFHAGA